MEQFNWFNLLIVFSIFQLMACGVACYSIATKKGHGGDWFFVGLLFGIVGLLWVGFLPPYEKQEAVKLTFNCPDCQRPLEYGEQICPNCGIEVAWDETPA